MRRFESDGLAGLTEGQRPRRPGSLNDRQLAKVEAALRASPRNFGLATEMWDGPTLSEFLARELEVKLKVRQCHRLFRQFGFRLRKPRPQVARADPLLQAAHKKLRALARRDKIDLWAMDEVHFQQHGSRCRLWVPPEVADPICLHAPTRKSISFFGAVRLKDGKLAMSQPRGRFDAVTWGLLSKIAAPWHMARTKTPYDKGMVIVNFPRITNVSHIDTNHGA